MLLVAGNLTSRFACGKDGSRICEIKDSSTSINLLTWSSLETGVSSSKTFGVAESVLQKPVAESVLQKPAVRSFEVANPAV